MSLGHEFDQSQVRRLIPRLAMNLVMGMPEYFPGEHLQTAQMIVTGTTTVMMPECLKLIIYQVSNCKDSLWKADDFGNLYTLISRTGLLSATDSLRRARQQDLTTRAFMDNLFTELVRSICYDDTIMNMENPRTRVKWLLSSGQDPNIKFIFPYNMLTALEHTILSRRVELIEPLLKAGAVASRSWNSSSHQSIMRVVLSDRVCNRELARIVRLLVGHYKTLTAEETLHAAILL